MAFPVATAKKEGGIDERFWREIERFEGRKMELKRGIARNCNKRGEVEDKDDGHGGEEDENGGNGFLEVSLNLFIYFI